MAAPLSTLDAARSYRDAGLSVFPIKDKNTFVLAWGKYKGEHGRLATDDELDEWFGKQGYGIGIAHGVISGNSFVIDFDTAGAYPEFATVCTALGTAPLLGLLVRVETPSGGVHLYGRCDSPVKGNTKLAQARLAVPLAEAEALTEEERKSQGIRHDEETGEYFKLETKIETRGEGGYTVASGSPLRVHPLGLPYKVVSGALTDLPVIALDNLVALLDIARSLTEWAEPAPKPKASRKASAQSTGGMPGEDYNKRTSQDDTLALLIGDGWAEIGRRTAPHGGEAIDLARPGKAVGEGRSATLGYVAPGVLYVFSSNAPLGFPSEHAYDAFGVYTRTQHGGDFRAAAKTLAAKGYGEQTANFGQGARVDAETDQTAGGAPETSHGAVPTYEIKPSGIYWNRRTEDGIRRSQLANFSAYIVQDILEDDGAETRRRFTIEAALPEQSPSRFEVSASEFGGMDWAIDRLGSRALLAPGRGTKDHARAAIQTLSDAKEKRVHTHTGWIQQGESWHYCHGGASGAIGAATASGGEPERDSQEIAVSLSG